MLGLINSVKWVKTCLSEGNSVRMASVGIVGAVEYSVNFGTKYLALVFLTRGMYHGGGTKRGGKSVQVFFAFLRLCGISSGLPS